MSETFRLAKLRRDRTLARTAEIYAACECEFPLRTWRSGYGHGKTVDGAPCPAIRVVERHNAEDREARAVLGG